MWEVWVMRIMFKGCYRYIRQRNRRTGNVSRDDQDRRPERKRKVNCDKSTGMGGFFKQTGWCVNSTNIKANNKDIPEYLP